MVVQSLRKVCLVAQFEGIVWNGREKSAQHAGVRSIWSYSSNCQAAAREREILVLSFLSPDFLVRTSAHKVLSSTLRVDLLASIKLI